MNDETLQRANEIKARLKQIEKEKDFLTEFMPPVKEVCREKEGRYGRFFRLFHAKTEEEKKKWINLTGTNYQSCLEVTNDDIRAMYELRNVEQKELEEEFKQLN